MLGNNQTDSNQMSAADNHDQVMKQLDEIKRYAAGIFSKVDTEIDDIRKMLERVERQVRDNDQQISRIEQASQQIRNIESTVREIERKVR